MVLHLDSSVLGSVYVLDQLVLKVILESHIAEHLGRPAVYLTADLTACCYQRCLC